MVSANNMAFSFKGVFKVKQNAISTFIKKQLPFVLLMGAWVGYSSVYIYLKQSKDTAIYAGVLIFIAIVGIEIVSVLLTFLLWKRTAGQGKTLFGLFSISFLFLTVNSISYFVKIVLGIIIILPIEIPFISFLIFQLLGWIIIFLKSKPIQNNRTFFISYLPVILVLLFIFAIFFLPDLTWGFEYSPYYILQFTLQITNFAFALLCLAIAANKQIRFIATGFLINTACDFFTTYSVASLIPFPMTEIIWLLGLTLIVFGFSGMFRNFSDLKMDKWLNSLNSVQAQCVLWSFVLYMLLLAVFCGILIGYNLLKMLPLQYLPSILITFSVLAVLISSIPAKVLSAPFEQVRTVIDSYLNENGTCIVQEKLRSNVYEFELLEDFLEKSFDVLRERNMAQQELFKCASQVAHDIRSPSVALSMVSKHLPELPEQKREIIRNASQRINDIANNLLVKYKTDKENGSEIHLKSELVSSLLDHLISEKRDQMAEKSIELVLESDSTAYSCFVNLEPGKFKRVISNLVNNASEAIESNGIIKIILALEKETTPDNPLSTVNYQPSTVNCQLSTNILAIKIIDNGKGISEDILLKIKQGIVASSKKEGCGIGISSAIQNIKSWGGSYDIQSKVGEGTTFIVRLPIAEPPDWFQSRLEIIQGMNVVVLDDDHSIHGVWDIRFQEYIKNNQITLKHFHEPSEIIEYCEALSSTKTLFLMDYELLGFKETGLDLIEKLSLKDHTILVTSRYEEPAIRDKIIKLGIKAIPKNFAQHIAIEFK